MLATYLSRPTTGKCSGPVRRQRIVVAMSSRRSRWQRTWGTVNEKKVLKGKFQETGHGVGYCLEKKYGGGQRQNNVEDINSEAVVRSVTCQTWKAVAVVALKVKKS